MCHFDEDPKGKIIDRRSLIGMIGVGAATAFLGAGTASRAMGLVQRQDQRGQRGATMSQGKATKVVNCVAASPEMTIGPFFVEEGLNRSDVRSDPTSGKVKEGVPFELEINLVKLGATCYAIEGATVDIWHCDAEGLYSDVRENGTQGQKFLRGHQVSDADGKVKFKTIYPGWYRGRCVHIHIRVRMMIDGNTADFVSQVDRKSVV